MALFASGRVTKPLRQKSHGLADPYDVPLSPSKTRSPLKSGYMPRSIRRLTHGQKRLKAALSPGVQLGNGTLNYSHSRDEGGYEFECAERAPKRQKSVQDESQANRSVEENGLRTESPLDDITERAKNRLIGMALEGLLASGEVSSMSTTATPVPARKTKRTTWETTIPSINTNTEATFRGAFIQPSSDAIDNAFANEARDPTLYHGAEIQMLEVIPGLEPSSGSNEDLVAAEYDKVDVMLHNADLSADNQPSGRGDGNVELVTRASIPYPESLLLDTTMDVETENTTGGRLSEEFSATKGAEIEDPSVSDAFGRFGTHVMDAGGNSNVNGTCVGETELIQDMLMDETGHAEFLVRRKGLDIESTTWESEETILSSAPKLLLQYLKAVILNGQRGEQVLKSGRIVRSDYPVRDDQDPRDEQEAKDDQEMRDDQEARDGQELRDDPELRDRQEVADDQEVVNDQGVANNQEVANDQEVVNNQEVINDQEEPAMEGESIVKRGRGRPRGSKNRKVLKMMPVPRVSRKLRYINTVDSGVNKRPRLLPRSSMISEDLSLTASQPLANDETPPTVVKRGLGRPHESGKNKLSAKTPQRTGTAALENVETSKLSETPGNLVYSVLGSLRSRSRVSRNRDEPQQSNFLMPTAIDILEAAGKLMSSRARLRDFAPSTQSRPGRPVGSQNKAVPNTSDKPTENPYKKHYITGESNRGLKLPPATYSALAMPPKGVWEFSMPAATDILEAAGKLKAFQFGPQKRRGQPPRSRNKRMRALPATLLPSRSSRPAVTSEGTRKNGRGRPRGSPTGDIFMAMGQFYHRVSKRPRQKRFRRCPRPSIRLRE